MALYYFQKAFKKSLTPTAYTTWEPVPGEMFDVPDSLLTSEMFNLQALEWKKHRQKHNGTFQRFTLLIFFSLEQKHYSFSRLTIFR